mmetsp:Transcript_55042/g.107653  ORF Transcript_55042/g.107653 Transcript_55042/m.107653 type:complete len:544 (+) Transcript_55042:1-1632(+)
MEIEDDPNLDGEYEEGAEQVDKEEVASLVWEYRSLMPTRKFDSPDALMHLSDGELLDCFTEVVRALERKTPPEAVRNAKLTREDMLNLLLEDPDFLPKDFRENAESMRWLVEDASDSDVKDIFEEVFYKEVDLEDVDLEKLHFTQAEKMGLRPWKRDAAADGLLYDLDEDAEEIDEGAFAPPGNDYEDGMPIWEDADGRPTGGAVDALGRPSSKPSDFYDYSSPFDDSSYTLKKDGGGQGLSVDFGQGPLPDDEGSAGVHKKLGMYVKGKRDGKKATPAEIEAANNVNKQFETAQPTLLENDPRSWKAGSSPIDVGSSMMDDEEDEDELEEEEDEDEYDEEGDAFDEEEVEAETGSSDDLEQRSRFLRRPTLDDPSAESMMGGMDEDEEEEDEEDEEGFVESKKAAKKKRKEKKGDEKIPPELQEFGLSRKQMESLILEHGFDTLPYKMPKERLRSLPNSQLAVVYTDMLEGAITGELEINLPRKGGIELPEPVEASEESGGLRGALEASGWEGLEVETGADGEDAEDMDEADWDGDVDAEEI